jgi:hypothetical protein
VPRWRESRFLSKLEVKASDSLPIRHTQGKAANFCSSARRTVAGPLTRYALEGTCRGAFLCDWESYRMYRGEFHLDLILSMNYAHTI